MAKFRMTVIADMPADSPNRFDVIFSVSFTQLFSQIADVHFQRVFHGQGPRNQDGGRVRSGRDAPGHSD